MKKSGKGDEERKSYRREEKVMKRGKGEEERQR